jgi:D-alanyl-D-alanine carboxypeptidase
MAILAKHVFSDERLLPYISAGSYTLPKTNKNPERTLISTNQLLRANSGNYYKYAVAGKTGSTSAAGYNLISMAKYKGMEYIAITMNASYKENDTNPVFEDSIALYKWAFSNFSVQSLLAEETSVYEMSVQLCAKSDHVLLMPKGAVDAVIENGSKVEDYKTVDLFKGVDAAERSKVLEFMKAHPQTPLAELGASYYAWREAAALKGVTDQKKIQKIKGGEELTLADQTAKTVLNNYTQGLKSEGEQKYLWFILAEQEADAPIVKGADFGDVIIAERNTQGELVAEYGRVDLVAANDLERSNILYYLDVIRNVFNNIYVRLAVIILVLLIVAYIIFMIWQNKKKRRRRIARRIKF